MHDQYKYLHNNKLQDFITVIVRKSEILKICQTTQIICSHFLKKPFILIASDQFSTMLIY